MHWIPIVSWGVYLQDIIISQKVIMAWCIADLKGLYHAGWLYPENLINKDECNCNTSRWHQAVTKLSTPPGHSTHSLWEISISNVRESGQARLLQILFPEVNYLGSSVGVNLSKGSMRRLGPVSFPGASVSVTWWRLFATGPAGGGGDCQYPFDNPRQALRRSKTSQ